MAVNKEMMRISLTILYEFRTLPQDDSNRSDDSQTSPTIVILPSQMLIMHSMKSMLKITREEPIKKFKTMKQLLMVMKEME